MPVVTFDDRLVRTLERSGQRDDASDPVLGAGRGEVTRDDEAAHRMADKVDARVRLVVGIGVVVAQQQRAVDHLVDEGPELRARSRQRLTPVIGKRVHRHGLIVAQAKVVPQLLDQLLIGNLVELTGHDSRRLDRLVAKIVRMQRRALVLFGALEHLPDRVGRKRVLVAQIGRDDAGNNNDGIWHSRHDRTPPEQLRNEPIPADPFLKSSVRVARRPLLGW